MEAISEILSLIAFIALVAMVVGLIRPTLVIHWGEKRTRGHVLLYYGVGTILLRILATVQTGEIMETISTILAMLFVIALIAIVVGLIRPTLVIRWGEKHTRGHVLLYYGVGVIVLGILGPAMESEDVKIGRAEKNFEKGTRLLSVARKAYDAQDYQTAIDSADVATNTLKSAKHYISEATILADQAKAFLDSAKVAYIASVKLAPVKIDDKWGYINTSGEVVIPTNS